MMTLAFCRRRVAPTQLAESVMSQVQPSGSQSHMVDVILNVYRDASIKTLIVTTGDQAQTFSTRQSQETTSVARLF